MLPTGLSWAVDSDAYQPRRQARHETLRVRGLDMHITRWGPPPAVGEAPLCLLHGFMDAGGTFQFLVDALQKDWPVLAVDWRGFGLSQWARDGYLFHDYIADLDELLDQVAPFATVPLVGHSMGGNIASLYAGVRPERVRCLVNLEGFGLTRSSPQQSPLRMRKWLEQIKKPTTERRYSSFEQLAAVLRFRNLRFSPATAAFVARVWGTADEDGRVRLAADPRHNWVTPTIYRREDAEATWEQIRAPMLMLLGEESDYLKRLGEDGTMAGLQRIFPGVQSAAVPGTGHMLHIERPDLVAPLVEAFLDAN
jgi:pimeloyl-ACP methyl ester carboxylesterase